MSLVLSSRTIPHSQQRYDTAGDWWDWSGGPGSFRLFSRVSEMGDWRYEYLVAMHEFVEAALARHRGISEASVTAFDQLFEAERAQGAHPEDAEPGDDPRSPYRKEHEFATAMERLISAELGVVWAEYEKAISALGDEDGGEEC